MSTSDTTELMRRRLQAENDYVRWLGRQSPPMAMKIVAMVTLTNVVPNATQRAQLDEVKNGPLIGLWKVLRPEAATLLEEHVGGQDLT